MEDIVIRRLCKSYAGRPVLREFSARLPAGGIICLMAPSGWGKTTLLRVLMGLVPADSGTVSGLAGLRVGAVFQEDRLCPQLTAADNLRLPVPALTDAQARAALAAMGLSGCADTPAAALSGGQRRRTAILRALLFPSDALFLDEPFRGLDAGIKPQVIAETLRRREGRTTLVVTHDPAEAEALGAINLLVCE